MHAHIRSQTHTRTNARTVTHTYICTHTHTHTHAHTQTARANVSNVVVNAALDARDVVVVFVVADAPLAKTRCRSYFLCNYCWGKGAISTAK